MRYLCYTYKKGKGALTDIQFAVDLFGSHEALLEYLAQENDDSAMDEPDHDWPGRRGSCQDDCPGCSAE